MATLWIHAKERVEGMYAGQVYAFEADEYRELPEDVVRHLAKKSILEVVNSGPVRAAQPKEVKPSVVCDLCGKDFSDKERPGYSLRQHLAQAHKPEED